MADTDDRVQLRHPDPTKSMPRLDRTTYEAAVRVARRIVPAAEPGITLDDYLAHAAVELPAEPGWDASRAPGWWAMAVKLDLEARGIFRRANSKPPQRLIQVA